jgi:hypothetical protein
MERTKIAAKKVPVEKRIKWINKGGKFRMRDGTVILPGKTFMAAPSDVPEAFRDVLKPVDVIPKEAEFEVAPNIYTSQAREDGAFDILDSRGKVVNDKPLNEVDAKEVLDRLNG